MALFLQASTEHPRNQKRMEITREIMMVEGMNTDLIQARGESRMEQMWSMLLFGDYTAYYLAMAYKVDPTQVESIEAFKAMMSDENA
jgi:glucose/mannose-6-phosphate isomerase